MSNINRKICRLCLRATCDNDFDPIGEVTKNMLDTLLKLNLEISVEPIMCKECAKNVQESFDFKVACLGMHNKLLQFGNSIVNNCQECDVSEYYKLCQICMNRTKGDSLTILYESKENAFIFDILQKYLPELNLNISDELVTCKSCLKSLQVLSSFVTNCLEVEAKIKNYVDIKGTDDKYLIELNEVQQFTLNTIINEVGMDHATENSVKIKKEQNEETEEVTVKREIESVDFSEIDAVNSNIKDEDTEIDMEYRNSISVLDTTTSKCTVSENALKDEIRQYIDIDGTEIKGQVELSDVQKFTDEPILKDAFGYSAINEVEIQQTCEEKELNAMEGKIKIEDIVEVDFLAINVKMEEVDAEINQSGNERYLDTMTSKRRISKNIHKCNKCTYETKNKSRLKNHMIIHKDQSEVTWHKCPQCPFQTKHKVSLRTHSLIHKIPSEIKMFQCYTCSYKTKHKGNLIKHMDIHRNPAELPTYKCDKCTYETRHRNNIYVHRLVHSEDPIVYQCDECMFMTKHKQNIRKHKMRHKGIKDPMNDRIFSCDVCAYTVKKKANLREHMIIHAPGEILFKCKLCPYKARLSRNLKAHARSHKNPSEVKKYKCDKCLYENKSKYGFINHINRKHKSRSEVTMYKCKKCKFETMDKAYLKKHEVIHKDPSEVEIFKCDWCLYESRNKYHLKKHMLTHRIYNPIYKNAYD